MKIAQIAPLTEPVPPRGHGAIEYVTWLLTEELVKRGHDVTLFASGDSRTSARLRSHSRLSFRAMGRSEVLLEYVHAVKSFREAIDTCDLIHNHTEFFGLGLRDLVPVPVLTTLHSPCDTPGAADLVKAFDQSPCVALSQAHRRALPPGLNIRSIIPHGLSIAEFPFVTAKDDYVLFLGRAHPNKGLDLAIDAARQAGMRLVIAAPVDRYYSDYWETRIQPQIDGDRVVYVGEVHGEAKLDLLSRARALLFPIQWEEPFGLVMVEALACGTPVVALRRGAVPEVIREGITGFIADIPEALPYALKQVQTLDPRQCRSDAETRFSVGRMTDDYLAAYARLQGQPQWGSPLPALPEAGLRLLAGELADWAGIPYAEALSRLEQAPHLLAQRWFEADVRDEAGRSLWYGSEPMLAFEHASQSLDERVRQMLGLAVELGEAQGARRWLSYRTELGSLALLAPGEVDVAEVPGPTLDFVRWRLERRRSPAGIVPCRDAAALAAGCYDVIVAGGAIEREPDPVRTLDALVRALQPGGLFIASPAYLVALDQPWVAPDHIGWHRRWQPEALGLDPVQTAWPLVFRRRS
jgi:glycosyltransferase involved in cell wall biosynthesis/SAM-dependent methyltransferase